MRIELFGAPAIRVGDERFEHRSRKAMALLAYLAMRADEHLSRSHLAALLWRDSGEEQARANLRQTLSQLRKLFKQAGQDPIMVPFDKVVLSSDGLTIDARSLMNGGVSVESRVVAGWPDFLEGFSVGAPEFERWMIAQRSAIRSRLIEGLEEAARDAAQENKHAAASENLALALNLDPMQEVLHRRLMESLAAQGKSDEALAQFETCRAILAAELDVEPEAETRQLAARIRATRLKSPSKKQSEEAFNRYPDLKPATIFVRNGLPDSAVKLLGRYPDSKSALRDALEAVRWEDDIGSIAVMSDTDGMTATLEAAALLLAEAEPGDVVVDNSVFQQFEYGSPFAFEPRKNGPKQEKSYRLVSEIPPTRISVLPTKNMPQATQSSEFSVAVMPLGDLSPDASKIALGDLMSEEIAHRLSRFNGISVASPSACQSFCAQKLPLEQVYQHLGVSYRVDGHVLRNANRLRVKISMTDVRTNKLTFSDNFDGEFDQIFDHQDELADRIASNLFKRGQDAETQRAQRLPTSDMTAYDWFLRGLATHRKGYVLPENSRTAFDQFSKAIELDPDFAGAIAWRICAVARFAPEYFEEPGLQEIHHALKVDENNAEVRRIAGALHFYRGDYDDGILHINRATEINPIDTYLLATSAVYHAYVGAPEKGLELVERALELDPFLPVYCVEDHGVVLFALDAFGESIEAFQRLSYPTPRSLAYMAASQMAQGDEHAAKETIMKLHRIAPDFSFDKLMVRFRFKEQSKNADLQNLLNKAGLH